jgi:hypothetical protein
VERPGKLWARAQRAGYFLLPASSCEAPRAGGYLLVQVENCLCARYSSDCPLRAAAEEAENMVEIGQRSGAGGRR